MPHPYPLASVFTEGMRRDVDRTMLPGGSVYNLVDFVPDEIGAAAVGRGGWTFAGPSLETTSVANVLGYHADSAKVIVQAENHYYDGIAGGSSLGATASALFSSAPPFYHRGKLFFTGNSGSVLRPQYYDGTTIAQLSTGPTAAMGCAYKDHAVLANGFGTDGASTPNRVWFSAAGDPTTWDMNFGWWDTTGTISGLASMPNAILVFHKNTTERLRGSTPPPGSDMVLEPFLPEVGCIDPNSIAYWNENVIWASSQGIYMSNGTATDDLTSDAQMKTYWQSLLSGYATNWRISGGVYRDHYIVSIVNTQSGALVDCLCVDLTNKTMWRFTNLLATGFVNVTTSIQEKLYMGLYAGTVARIAELSSLWSPAAAVKKDADNNVPTPIIETGSFRGYDRLHRRWIQSMGIQKWRYVYLDYDLRDAATDNPTITLSYATTPGGGYTAMTGGNITESTDYSRSRRSVHSATQGAAVRSNMIEYKIAINGPTASAKLYTLEGTFEPIDIGRLK